MSDMELNGWSAQLPDLLNDALSPEERNALERALESDPELQAEAAVLQALQAARPEPPADLAARISAQLREDASQKPQRSGFAAGWRLSSAAILVLAMGTAVIWQNRFQSMPTFTVPAVDAAPLSDSWLLDDGVVAGGAVLEDLTNEELTLLLEELEA